MSQEHHILPLKVYLGVGASLFFLTIITVAASYVDFTSITGISGLNLIIAMLIATVKASLVAFIFMHLFFDNKLYTLYLGVSLVVLAIFIGITVIDSQRRGEFDEREKRPIQEQVEYKVKADSNH